MYCIVVSTRYKLSNTAHYTPSHTVGPFDLEDEAKDHARKLGGFEHMPESDPGVFFESNPNSDTVYKYQVMEMRPPSA